MKTSANSKSISNERIQFAVFDFPIVISNNVSMHTRRDFFIKFAEKLSYG